MLLIVMTINIFICFFLSKVINPYHKAFRVYSLISIFGLAAELVISALLSPYNFLAVSMILLALYILGRREYLDLFVKEVNLKTNGNKNINALFVADTQFDITGYINDEAFENTIAMINDNPADLLLLGGDYLNQPENIHLVVSKFAMIDQSKFKYGVYAVMGNHDYVNYENLIMAFEEMGIRCLENKYVKIPELDLNLVGIVDSWRNQPNYNILEQFETDLGSTIVLAHQPDEIDQMQGDFDLMLSGHYHAGQMNFIFGIQLNALVAKYIYGLYEANGNKLFVTSGVGGSIGRFKYAPYLRYLARPEVAMIKLRGEHEES